jgi:NitT/TauT family transport system substrate-binding protein
MLFAAKAAFAGAVLWSAPSDALAQAKLVVAKAEADFAFMPANFALKLGIFKKHGLDVDIGQIVQAKMIQAITAGSVDIALASGASLPFAARGAPFKAVAALSGPPLLLVLVTKPDGKLKTMDQLKGATVGVSNVGSLTDWLTTQVALHQGWKPEEIKRVSIGNTPSRVAALRTGAVDAVVVDIAAALKLEEEGHGRILVRFGKVVTQFQNQLIFAADRAISDKPDAVRGFVAAWFDVMNYVRTNKPETVAFAQENLNISASVAAKVYDELVNSDFFSKDGIVDPSVLEAMRLSFIDAKRLKPEIDLRTYVTDRFLPSRK